MSSLIWGSSPDIYFFLTVKVLFLWGALSDERTGLSFEYAAGPRQRSLPPLVLVTIFYCLRFETSMPQMRFEPMIPEIVRGETVHILDRVATVIGKYLLYLS
jgi:hypothetical protein